MPTTRFVMITSGDQATVLCKSGTGQLRWTPPLALSDAFRSLRRYVQHNRRTICAIRAEVGY